MQLLNSFIGKWKKVVGKFKNYLFPDRTPSQKTPPKNISVQIEGLNRIFLCEKACWICLSRWLKLNILFLSCLVNQISTTARSNSRTLGRTQNVKMEFDAKIRVRSKNRRRKNMDDQGINLDVKDEGGGHSAETWEVGPGSLHWTTPCPWNSFQCHALTPFHQNVHHSEVRKL